MTDAAELMRPTLRMIKDVRPGQATDESWIFNDCVVWKLRNPTVRAHYIACLFKRISEGPYEGSVYYGYINLSKRPTSGLAYSAIDDRLARACECLQCCPAVFDRPVIWADIEGGYYYGKV